MKTQKSHVGLLMIAGLFVFGAGCADSAQTATTQIQDASSTVTTTVEEARETISKWQKIVAKLQAIYAILHSDDEASSDSNTTPSVPPNEDQPQPEAEENTTSQ